MTQASVSSQPKRMMTSRRLWQTVRDGRLWRLIVAALLPMLALLIGTLILLEGEPATAPLNGQVLALAALIAAVSVILGVALAVWRRGQAQVLESDRLRRTLDFLYKVDGGDLTSRLVPLAPDDGNFRKLAEALNVMADGLQRMTGEVRTATQGLATSAEEIRIAASRQLDAAERQDTVVTQTTATVNEVRATVTETAERAQNVAENAQASIEVSRTGEQAVTDAIDGMNLIRRKVEDIADNILILSEHTQQIGEIIATVNSIADQSKMLALNASVEAARAGEEGKGFAVVAMEVRNLAEQSREATAQVRDILSEIQRATNAAVMVTEEGTKGVDRGVNLVDRAGQTIRDLTLTIEDNAVAAVQIAASTRQQAVGMDQLTNAMRTIKEATAEATSSTVQVERNVQQLQGIAEHLGATLNRYRL
ncbi:MAG: methyl-accepting chemotaxis protein [Anaerolineae bacterium]|nr:methyl-accepting chemotaxis protein [Anaerolineae bacterium]